MPGIGTTAHLCGVWGRFAGGGRLPGTRKPTSIDLCNPHFPVPGGSVRSSGALLPEWRAIPHHSIHNAPLNVQRDGAGDIGTTAHVGGVTGRFCTRCLARSGVMHYPQSAEVGCLIADAVTGYRTVGTAHNDSQIPAGRRRRRDGTSRPYEGTFGRDHHNWFLRCLWRPADDGISSTERGDHI